MCKRVNVIYPVYSVSWESCAVYRLKENHEPEWVGSVGGKGKE